MHTPNCQQTPSCQQTPRADGFNGKKTGVICRGGARGRFGGGCEPRAPGRGSAGDMQSRAGSRAPPGPLPSSPWIIWSMANAGGGWAGASELQGRCSAPLPRADSSVSLPGNGSRRRLGVLVARAGGRGSPGLVPVGFTVTQSQQRRRSLSMKPQLRTHQNTSGFPLQTLLVLLDCLLLVNTREICPGASTPLEQTVSGYLSQKSKHFFHRNVELKKTREERDVPVPCERGQSIRTTLAILGQSAPCWGNTQGWLALIQSCPFLRASAFVHALHGVSQPLGRATPRHHRFGATAQTFNFNLFISLLSLKITQSSVSVSRDSIKEYQLHCEFNLFFSMYSLNSRLLLCYLMELMV